MSEIILHIINSGEKNQVIFTRDPSHQEFSATGTFGKVAFKEYKENWCQMRLISLELNQAAEINIITNPVNVHLNYCLQGSFLFQSSESEYDLVAQTQYGIQFNRSKSVYTYAFKPSQNNKFLVFSLSFPSGFHDSLRFKSNTSSLEFQKFIFEIIKEIHKEHPSRRRLKSLVELLIMESLEEIDLRRFKMQDKKPLNPDQRLVYLMAEKMILGMDEAWTIKRLAGSQQVNPNKVKTIFKKYMGVPATTFKISVRMQKAKDLLMDPKLNIQDISTQVGYLNPAQFSTIFKRKMGCSPSQLRKKMIKAQET